MILQRRKLALSLVALVILGVGFALPTLLASPVDWPMFRFNPEHTGATTDVVTPPLIPIWSYDTGSGIGSSPAVSGGVVYIGAGYKVYALNAIDGTHIWNYTTDRVIHSSPAVSEGVVYIGSNDNNVYALDATTGGLIWKYTTGAGVASSPAVADGRVYVGSGDNRVYCLDASSGAYIWNYTTGDRIESSPAVSEGVVYIGSYDNTVYALDATTGARIWDYMAGSSVHSSPTVSGGIVYVGSVTGGVVHAINATTGDGIWDYVTGFATYSSPAVSGGVVYIGSSSPGVFALDATTGAHIWNNTKIGMILSSPAVSGGVVYVGSYSNYIYALRATTGDCIWYYQTGLDIYSSPAVSGDNVYIGSYDGKVYAFTVGTQYQLTVATYPAGLEPAPVVEPPDLWYDVGTEVTCTAQEVAGYEFSHWVVDSVSQGAGVNPITVNMDVTHTAYAYYTLVGVPDFNIAVEPTSRNVVLGGSTTATVNVTSIYGYSEIVTLSASGQPAGVSVSIDPGSGTPNFTSTMTISVGEDVEPKTWSITITGTGADEKVNTAIFSCVRAIDIEADGSIDPPDAPISSVDDVTYTFTENIYDEIWVLRNNITIDGNGYILQGSGTGSGVYLSSWNVTIENMLITSFDYGVFLDWSNYNNITGNTITNNTYGVELYGSSNNNTIARNTIINNEYGIQVWLVASGWWNNKFNHNNFIGNEIQASVLVSGCSNFWDDGVEGNFWDDYSEFDTSIPRDGIGDTPYIIDVDNRDRYPLVVPIGPIPIIWDGTIYPVELDSNSTISRFQVDISENMISFNVTGLDGTLGFCSLTLPNSLVQELWEGNFTVLVDGEEPIMTNSWTDGTYTYIYFTYEHSTHEVVIQALPPSDTTLPDADAGSDQTVKVNTQVSFDASGSSDNVGIVSYEWDFGDGTTGSGATATHTYSQTGTYTVTLNVTDAAGNSDTDTVMINVEEAPGFPLMMIGIGAAVIIIIAAVYLTVMRKPS